MKPVMLLGYIVAIVSTQGYAGQNLSSLSISVGTASTSTYAQVLVVDPLGRKTGFDPGLKRRVKGIPASSYVTESVDDYDGASKGDESAVFTMNNPIPGDYSVVLIGLGDAKYSLQIHAEDSDGKEILSYANIYTGTLSLGTSQQYLLAYSPTPGAPAPVITKIVTFDSLRQDLTEAQKLNQLGDDKFVGSLMRVVNMAEKLLNKCEDHKDKGLKEREKEKCEPAIDILKMFIRRLETANKKCETGECDEDKDLQSFEKAHQGDKDLKEFFDADKDDQHSGTNKRFVSDEALNLIREDAQWLIKSFGGEI